jgi:hypothetical protein
MKIDDFAVRKEMQTGPGAAEQTCPIYDRTITAKSLYGCTTIPPTVQQIGRSSQGARRLIDAAG